MTMIALLVLLLYFALPVFFLIQKWRDRSADLGKWVVDTFFQGSYMVFVFFAGPWSIAFSYYFRYLLPIAFVLVSVKSFLNVNRSFHFRSVAIKQVCAVFIGMAVGCFFMWHIFLILSGSFHMTDGVALEFPLKNGEFCIVQGGASPSINHHYDIDAQRYALDIVQLNKMGMRSNKLNPKTLDDYNIYGSRLYSPASGKVIVSVDGYQDLEPGIMDPEHPAGNYLAIEIKGSDRVVLLAHLMRGSLLVKSGDLVERGQPLAKVGNSGNTTEPHLHMHVATGEFLFNGEGIPMTFDNRFLSRNDRVH
jgi:hypothetical protein